MDVYKVNGKSFQKRWKIVLREQLQQTKTKYWMQLLQSFSSTDAFFWNVHWRMKKKCRCLWSLWKTSEADLSDAESTEGESDEDWKKSEQSDKTDRKKQSLRDTGRGISLASLSFLKHAQEGKKDADMCGVCGKHFETKETLKLRL